MCRGDQESRLDCCACSDQRCDASEPEVQGFEHYSGFITILSRHYLKMDALCKCGNPRKLIDLNRPGNKSTETNSNRAAEGGGSLRNQGLAAGAPLVLLGAVRAGLARFGGLRRGGDELQLLRVMGGRRRRGRMLMLLLLLLLLLLLRLGR
ncbi:hypothetical protein EYF80_044128 [Liparis tanakae]|uniref:Uncharacterized protein n=1 Tax=Liparis tanakae TaxID=230148 RepID=A0A4Z2FWL4_9TELE|nr:hypothetical protein EYF80_044128 [Liparis tanakae]